MPTWLTRGLGDARVRDVGADDQAPAHRRALTRVERVDLHLEATVARGAREARGQRPARTVPSPRRRSSRARRTRPGRRPPRGPGGADDDDRADPGAPRPPRRSRRWSRRRAPGRRAGSPSRRTGPSVGETERARDVARRVRDEPDQLTAVAAGGGGERGVVALHLHVGSTARFAPPRLAAPDHDPATPAAATTPR